jgi:large-conductance mechanosensitive channel
MVQRFMAYIIDFTIIMQVIFGLVVDARLRLSRRSIKLAYTAYSNSEEGSKVHNEIKDHVVNLTGMQLWRIDQRVSDETREYEGATK